MFRTRFFVGFMKNRTAVFQAKLNKNQNNFPSKAQHLNNF